MANNSNPLILMVAITGKPLKDKIYSFVKLLADVKITQIMIYPRDGCELEYMSDEWFEMCDNFIKAARSHGMSIWLYDEFNWPSGKCNGRVMEINKEYSLKALTIENINGKNNVEILYDEECADILCTEAVDSFIRLTHEEYYKHFSQYFGNTVKGIFTDEPSFFYRNKNRVGVPYYKGMDAEYKHITGNELVDDFKRYFGGEVVEKFGENILGLLTDRMRSIYVDKIRKWCDEKNILMAGHLLKDDLPGDSIKSSGNILKVLGGFSLPGIDEISTFTELETTNWGAFATANYAAKKSGNGAMGELFALGPCDMPLSKQRKMLWLSALFGINHYFLAISHLDIRGNIKRNDWFSSFNSLQPWFEAMKSLGQEAKTAAFYAEKKSNSELVVRYPVSAAMKHFDNEDMLRKINGAYIDLLKALVSSQLQWELIDGEDLAPQNKPVLSVDDTKFFEEEGGISFDSAEKAIEWAEKRTCRSVCVKNLDLSLAENVLVKAYSDGSTIVLDLNEGDGCRILSLERSGEKIEFELYSRGVFISEKQKPLFDSYKKQPINNLNFEVKYSNLNYYRPIFSTDNTEFDVKDDMVNVNILLRDYPEEIKLTLDGENVLGEKACTELTDEVNSLYKISKSYVLKKGKHILSLSGKSSEYKYLPIALICGDFAVVKDTIVKRSPKVGIGELFADFGCVNLSTQIKIPEYPGRLYLQVPTNNLYTKLFIDGEYLGECLWEPYVWEIPCKFKCKTIEVTIKQFSSVAPLFGDVEWIEKNVSNTPKWCSGYYPAKVGFGLKDPLVWLFE